MITVQVLLENSYDRQYDDIKITNEEILQLACDKAKQNYLEGHWASISAEEIKVTANIY